jgi:Pyruvate/2-oxoacid:ferredoxin oxidoreductase gamma subunit
MNPLLQDPLAINEYFDIDDWEFTHVGPENTPVFTLTPEGKKRLTKDAIALYDRAFSVHLVNPSSYIEASIRKIIDHSSASQELKERINGKTLIAVDSVISRETYIQRRSKLKWLERYSPAVWLWINAPWGEETRHCPLDEIVTDTYRRKSGIWHTVKWPSDFPEDLVHALESANLQASYQAEINRHLNTPEAAFVAKLQLRSEVHTHLREFVKRPHVSEFYKNLVADYFKKKVALQLVEFASRVSRTYVSQALFLAYPSNALEAEGGLLIFVGEAVENSIMELPNKDRQQFIQSPGPLHALILSRLSLHNQLRTGNEKLAYYTSFPVGGPRVVSPLQFHKVDDAFDRLNDLKIKRLNSDIDFLVSTDEERLTARHMKAAAKALELIAKAAAVPAAPVSATAALLVGFLTGFAAIVLEAAQGAIADNPADAEAHFKAALWGYAQLVVGTVLGESLDSAFDNEATTAIAGELFEHVTALED